MVIFIDISERIALLVKEIQNGNQSAFDELYKLTNQRAYYIALEFVKKDEDAQDILQESYIKALSKIKELTKPESFQSWLNQIVANKSKDFLKKKKPMLFEAEENEVFEVLPDEDTSFAPEESLDQNELQQTVLEVLDELNEEKRACIMMMYFEELSVSEIAETLEIPEGTVKTRLFSARKDLKEKFTKRGITSAYSMAPIGVVLWTMRKTSVKAGAAFVASSGSTTVLAGITASGVLTATGVTAATVTGAGIAAKLAALSVAQKVIAGVSVAAVVAGSTAGVATVINNHNKIDTAATTAYTEEFTTAPHEGTTIVIQAADATVEVTLTDYSATRENVLSQSSSSNIPDTTTTQLLTNPLSTVPSSTTKPTSTARPTTTKPSTTKPTSTRASTTKPTTTRQTTTKVPATTAVKVTLANPKIVIYYAPPGESEFLKQLEFSVPPGTKIDNDYIYDYMMTKSNVELMDCLIDSANFVNSAEPGEVYKFEILCV